MSLVISRRTIARIAAAAIVVIAIVGYAAHINGGTLDFSETDARIVVSGSMDGEPREQYDIPTIPLGSLILIHEVHDYSSLKVGDILTFDYVHPVSHESMVVTASFSDGSSAHVDGYTWAPNGRLRTADTEVTIRYSVETCEQAISVSPWMTLEITCLPDTRAYDVDKELDAGDLVVTVRYHDGTSENVTGRCVFNYDTGSEGTKTVLVTYTENGHAAFTTFETHVVSSEGFSAVVVSDNGVQTPTPLSSYEFMGPMAPGDVHTLEIEVRNNASIVASPYLILDHVSGDNGLASAISVSCDGRTFTILDMKGSASVELDDIASKGMSTVTVKIAMDSMAGNELMQKSLGFRLGIFADGIPPSGGS